MIKISFPKIKKIVRPDCFPNFLGKNLSELNKEYQMSTEITNMSPLSSLSLPKSKPY